MRISDKILVEKIKKKDYEAFKKFYDEYVGLIHYIISLYIKDRSTVDDVTQEVLMRIIEKIHLFDIEKSRLKTWVATLTKNYTLNYLKLNKNTYSLDEEAIDRKASYNDTNYHFIKQDLKDVLEPLEYKVLFLKVESKMKHQDIAKILDITIDISKKTYIKAIQKAKAYFQKK